MGVHRDPQGLSGQRGQPGQGRRALFPKTPVLWDSWSLPSHLDRQAWGRKERRGSFPPNTGAETAGVVTSWPQEYGGVPEGTG